MLTAAHRARMRATQLASLPKRAEIWRVPPRDASRKTLAPAKVAENVACQIWPAAQAAKILTAVPDLASGRYAEIGVFLDDADIRAGDELRIGARVVMIGGVGQWTTLKVCGLSELAS